jgi:hypothetical protein
MQIEPIGAVACLTALTKMVSNPNGSWQATNNEQRTLLDAIPKFKEILTGLTEEEMRAFASNDYQELNKLLEEAGYPEAKLNPFNPSDFGAVAILDISFEWRHPGLTEDAGRRKIEINGKPAFRLCSNYQPEHGVLFAALNEEAKHPVVAVPTKKEGDHVLLYRTDEKREGFELYEFAESLIEPSFSHKLIIGEQEFVGVDIPMVDYNTTNDLSWLVGMTHGPDRIAQAKQQVRFKMNHNGGRGGSGTAMSATRGSIPHFYQIDGPFVFAYYRKNVGPILAVYVEENSFKDPGNLDL